MRFGKLALLCAFALISTGCAKSEKLYGMSVHFYSHMKGVMSGEVEDVYVKIGGTTCCVNLPEKWHPGLQVEVKYGIDMLIEPEVFNDKTLDRSTLPPPEVITVMVDVQEYKKLGSAHIHIMPGDKSKIIVTHWELGSPFYPLPREEWTPYKMNYWDIWKVVINGQIFVDALKNFGHPITEEDWKWASQWGLTKDFKCNDPGYLEWEKKLNEQDQQHTESQQKESK